MIAVAELHLEHVGVDVRQPLGLVAVAFQVEARHGRVFVAADVTMISRLEIITTSIMRQDRDSDRGLVNFETSRIRCFSFGNELITYTTCATYQTRRTTAAAASGCRSRTRQGLQGLAFCIAGRGGLRKASNLA